MLDMPFFKTGISSISQDGHSMGLATSNRSSQKTILLLNHQENGLQRHGVDIAECCGAGATSGSLIKIKRLMLLKSVIQFSWFFTLVAVEVSTNHLEIVFRSVGTNRRVAPRLCELLVFDPCIS